MEQKAKSGVLSVSQLLRQVNTDLGARYSQVAVEGEITNFSRSGAGHCYFTIKDSSAQLSVVLFASAARRIRFEIENGLAVVVRGKLTIYTQRGQFQLSAEFVEPVGIGALQLAFEQLKERLAHEGLFSEDRKRRLPLLPRRIAVVTSGHGAALRDILHVLRRRFDGLSLQVYSVRVQGRDAAREIELALRNLERWQLHDVIILSRGGGSLEDLWPFNEEIVARAISDCTIPVISGVGHEVDFTISDFVADLRAPTPSAAAEIVVESRESLQLAVTHRTQAIEKAMEARIARTRNELQLLSSADGIRAFPARISRKIRSIAERRTVLYSKLEEVARRMRTRLERSLRPIEAFPSRLALGRRIERVGSLRDRTVRSMEGGLERRRDELRALTSTLEAVSPLSILARGYAVAYRTEGKRERILTDPNEVAMGEQIRVQLSGGSLGCEVTAKTLGVEAVQPDPDERHADRVRPTKRRAADNRANQSSLPLGD